jgi:hypothetical protein
VRTVRAWGERKAVGGAVVQVTPVRPVWSTGQTGAGLDKQRFGFRARTGARVVSEVVVLVVGIESLQVVRLLGVLPLEFEDILLDYKVLGGLSYRHPWAC